MSKRWLLCVVVLGVAGCDFGDDWNPPRAERDQPSRQEVRRESPSLDPIDRARVAPGKYVFPADGRLGQLRIVGDDQVIHISSNCTIEELTVEGNRNEIYIHRSARIEKLIILGDSTHIHSHDSANYTLTITGKGLTIDKNKAVPQP